MVRVTGFVGYECEDIVLYLAKVLTTAGMRVLIMDKTEHQSLLCELLLDSTRKHMPDERQMEYEGICVTTEPMGGEEYDMILMLFGYRIQHPKLFDCELLVMVSDGYPAHAALLKEIGCWDRKQCLVFRNMVPAKYTDAYLLQEAGVEREECIYISLSERDMRSRYGMGFDERIQLNRLSSGMKQALCSLVGRLGVDISEKKAKKLLRVNYDRRG